MLAERYKLESRLGAGAMGVVWRAHDERLGRPVAVKTVAAELLDDDEALLRFEREAKAIAQLRSPHIVEVHDYGVDAGAAFMVMEMLDGEDLAARLRHGQRLSLAGAAHLVDQIARGLSSAHAAGIVHRDLKPANVFLVRDQDREIVKVFDFGVAGFVRRQRTRQLTEEGSIVGTPRYMSPEYLMGSPSDPRDDVWALALIAYRSICGVDVYRARGLAEVVYAIANDRPPPPSEHLPSLSPEVDAVFARALAEERDDRFQTAKELAVALREAAGVRAPVSRIEVVGQADPKAPEVAVVDEALATKSTMVRPMQKRSATRSILLASVVGALVLVVLYSATRRDGVREPAPAARPAPWVAKPAPAVSASTSATASQQPAASGGQRGAPASKGKKGPRPAGKPPAQPGHDMFDTVF